MASSSSSSSLSRTWRYGVFVSFNGQDVRKTFLGHLRKQFSCNGISMFDDQGIERGQTIGPALTQAIRESRISIVVLTKNYASSSWCLDELLEILKCKEDMGQIVMTVFHGVDPSHVRKQTGEFGIGFNDTCQGKTEDKKLRWSKALNDVGNIAGEHFLNWDNEAEMIEKIAKDVLGLLNVTPSSDFDGLVELVKAIFSNITRFFIYDRVKAMFSDNNLDVNNVKILVSEIIEMRRLLQKMARQASHKQEPWKRQILIDAHEICHVLENETGTSAVSGISFDTSGINEVSIGKKVYKSIADGNDAVDIPEEMEFPRRLRLLHWDVYPSRSLPPTFHLENLVELNMQDSQLEYLWQGTQPLTNLKKMNLRGSSHLKELPDLSNATNLETLYLDDCKSLVEIPSSFSHLQKLETLGMRNCTNIQVTPPHLNLPSLETQRGGRGNVCEQAFLTTNMDLPQQEPFQVPTMVPHLFNNSTSTNMETVISYLPALVEGNVDSIVPIDNNNVQDGDMASTFECLKKQELSYDQWTDSQQCSNFFLRDNLNMNVDGPVGNQDPPMTLGSSALSFVGNQDPPMTLGSSALSFVRNQDPPMTLGSFDLSSSFSSSSSFPFSSFRFSF